MSGFGGVGVDDSCCSEEALLVSMVELLGAVRCLCCCASLVWKAIHPTHPI
jgi:hypothetical protein